MGVSCAAIAVIAVESGKKLKVTAGPFTVKKADREEAEI